MTDAPLTIRTARAEDLPAIVALYAEDDLGGHGDAWSQEAEGAYAAGFARIAAAPGHDLFVAVCDGRIVGCFILSILPGLTERGLVLAELRSVQVASAERSRGIGTRMVAFAEEAARAAGAGRMELTSNLKRIAAHRFYDRLGYARSHAGFKKRLS